MGEGITTARARLMNFWIRARCTIEVTCCMTEGQRCKPLVSVDFHLCTRKREREECGRDDTWRSPFRVTSSGFTSRRKEREARNQRALGTVDEYVCVRRATIKNLKRATRMTSGIDRSVSDRVTHVSRRSKREQCFKRFGQCSLSQGAGLCLSKGLHFLF